MLHRNTSTFASFVFPLLGRGPLLHGSLALQNARHGPRRHPPLGGRLRPTVTFSSISQLECERALLGYNRLPASAHLGLFRSERSIKDSVFLYPSMLSPPLDKRLRESTMRP